MNLEECRRQMDEIDSEMIELLKQRAALSHSIGLMKLRAGLPVLDKEREAEIFRSISEQDMADICKESIASVYREILGESKKIQQQAVIELNGRGAAR